MIELVGTQTVGAGVGVAVAVQRHTPLTTDQVPKQGPAQAAVTPGVDVVGTIIADEEGGTYGVPPGTQVRVTMLSQSPGVQQVSTIC